MTEWTKESIDFRRYALLEVEPVRTDPGDPHFVETCSEEEAEFWSVYGRLPSGEAECLADRKTKRSAITLAETWGRVHDLAALVTT